MVLSMAEIVETRSSTFQKQFGRFRAIAHHTPVSVTSHGNPDVVLISAREYERLKKRDRQALLAADLSPEDVEALAAAVVPVQSADYDHEMEDE
jgi:prevent-host-death family protein